MNEAAYAKRLSAVVREMENTAGSADAAAVERLVDAITEAKRIYVAAAGRSRLMLSCMAMRLMHIGLTAYVVGDATTPAIREGDLLIAASGSGETSAVVSIAQKAKRAGATLAAITLHKTSSLAQTSDLCISLSDRWMKQSVQIGASAFEQATLVLCDTLACMAARKLDISDPNQIMKRLHSNLE